jgi:hypothetical protein
MTAIIIEGVLFLALLGVAGTLVVYLVRHHTGAGTALEQTRNRKQIDRAASLTCATHGPHEEREMVRLSSGEVVCPECYREAAEGHV